MMDLTDGLAKDLPAMLANGTCAMLDTANIPVSQDAHTMSTDSGKSALEHACCDGEDYELLLIVSASANIEDLEQAWSERFDTRLTCIGKIDTTNTQGHSRALIDTNSGKPLFPNGGYQHLKSNA